jgi:hypothetical protein
MPNPYWNAGYRGVTVPTHPEGTAAATPCVPETYTYGDGKSRAFTDVANVAKSLSPAATKLTAWDEGHSTNLIGGYVVILRAAANFGTDRVNIPFPSAPDGSLTAKRAQDLFRSPRMRHTDQSRAPHWAYSPNSHTRIENISVDAAATSASISFDRVEHARSCGYAIDPTSTLDNGDTAIPAARGGATVRFDISGLAAGTTYNLRITCGYGRGYVELTAKQ